MVPFEWNRSARSWAVNKLRAANKRASLHHRWTVATWQRWNIGRIWAEKGFGSPEAKTKQDKTQREMYGQIQGQANGSGNAFSCRICMS